MKRNSLDNAAPDYAYDPNNSSRAPSSQEIDYETQSFTSKEEMLSQRFKPFQNERDSTGKLIQRNQTLNSNGKKFNFLTGQQIILKTNSTRLQHSTTHLLGLQERAITAEDKQRFGKQSVKHFKVNLTADQGFIKQFRDYSKQIKPVTQMNSAFLSTQRDYFYKYSKFPGPGVYHKSSEVLDSQHAVAFPKSPQFGKMRQPYCQQDFYDYGKDRRKPYVPNFERTISREGAYQRSIFAQIEIQKRQNKTLVKDEIGEDQRIERDLEILHQQQLKADKIIPQQKQLELNVKLKRTQLPEYLEMQWGKTLDKYGFKKSGGRLYKQNNKSATHL